MYNDIEEAKKELGSEEVEAVVKEIGTDGEDIVLAGLNADVELENIAEAYNGKWDSDEEFTRDLVESCGDIPKDLPIYIHIDWEATASDIMMDYTEENRYYFRNL